MSAVAWDVDVAAEEARRRPHLVVVSTLPTGGSRAPGLPRGARLARTIALVLAAVVVSAVFAFGGKGDAAAPEGVTVKPGQTLSEIAAAELPEMSLNDGVVRLQVANNLASSQVTAGQHLVVPR